LEEHQKINVKKDSGKATERSMLSQMILGLAEKAVARTAHECGHSSECWGGIPVIVLFGDYYKPPAIGDPGATNIPKLNNKTSSKGMNDTSQCQGGL
jgi:hypothetical protein